MQTVQYRKSRIREVKEDKYTESLTKNQVCVILHMRDNRKNVLPKFAKLCRETADGQKYGGWKLTKTCL